MQSVNPHPVRVDDSRTADVLDLAILGLLQEHELPRLRDQEATPRRARPLLEHLVRLALPGLARLEAAGAVTAPSRHGRRPQHHPLTGSLGGERAALRARRAGSTRAHQAVPQGLPDHRHRASLFEELLAAGEPAGTDDARSFGFRLAFARHLAPEARLGLLERRRAQLVHRLAADRAPPPPGRPRPLHPLAGRAQHRGDPARHLLARPADRDRAANRSTNDLRGRGDRAGRDALESNEGNRFMSKIRVAIAGVGNCASSLIQGVEYYRDADPARPSPA